MPVVFCMSSRKLSKPLSAWGWHVCLHKWAWAHCTPSPTRAFWTPAVQQDHAAFGQGYFSGSSTPASKWEPLRLFLLGGFLAAVVSQLGALCFCSLWNWEAPSSIVMPSPSFLQECHQVGGQLSTWSSSWLAALWSWLSLLCNTITIANAAGQQQPGFCVRPMLCGSFLLQEPGGLSKSGHLGRVSQWLPPWAEMCSVR